MPWWDIENGEVVACDLQAWMWVGTKVDTTHDLRKDNRLHCTFKDGHTGIWKHPIERIVRSPREQVAVTEGEHGYR